MVKSTNKIFKTVIIEDDPLSINDINGKLSKYCSSIDIVGCADSVENAIKTIEDNQPDLVLMDVEIKGGSGFDILTQLENIDFEVIFITAHSHYAIKAIKFSALDYILKPIDIDELKEALLKLRFSKQSNLRINNLKDNSSDKLALPIDNGFTFIGLDDIIRIQGESNYTIFYLTDNKQIIISRTLKEYEELLGEFNFCRVHKKHIINIKHVCSYSKGKGGLATMSDGFEVAVSVRRKAYFLEQFMK